MSKDAIRTHLENHQPSERAASVTYTDVSFTPSVTINVPVDEEMRAKAGRVISAATASKLRAARDLMDELLELVGKDGDEEPQAKSAGPNDWVRQELGKFEEPPGDTGGDREE